MELLLSDDVHGEVHQHVQNAFPKEHRPEGYTLGNYQESFKYNYAGFHIHLIVAKELD